MAACCLRCCAIEDFMQGLMRPRIGRCCPRGNAHMFLSVVRRGAGGEQKSPLSAWRAITLFENAMPGDRTRRLRREWWDCRPERAALSFDVERKYQRKQAARRLQRRPTSLCTAAKPCGCAWAWLRASWLSAISGASRPSASLGRGLRSAGTERLDDPNKFGSSNSGLRAGTV